jgi:hypothetical protein
MKSVAEKMKNVTQQIRTKVRHEWFQNSVRLDRCVGRPKKKEELIYEIIIFLLSYTKIRNDDEFLSAKILRM